jgi:hypothetical protein
MERNAWDEFAVKVGGFVNFKRTLQAVIGVDPPIVISTLELETMEHFAACTSQTNAEQFCELGNRFMPEMTTLAFG